MPAVRCSARSSSQRRRRVSTALAVFLLAALGVVLWLVYWKTPMEGKVKDRKSVIDWSFLRSGRFWLLTGLLFCQNAAEQSVTGWMVTYFKGSGIIAGTLAAYTVTVMWGATLVARHAHCIRVSVQVPAQGDGGHGRDLHPVLCAPDAGRQPAGRDPAAVRLRVCDGRYEPHRSGQRGQDDQHDQHGHHAAPLRPAVPILMPWVIGRVAERAGLAAGMAMNIVPCVGLIIFSVLVERMSEQEYEKADAAASASGTDAS